MIETLHFDRKRLSVAITPPSDPACGYALSLHGGGLSTKEATDYLADIFTARGFGWVAFDCSGWGESGGERAECSLADRLDDALAVIGHYRLRLDFLVGTSMGGYIAVKLLQRVDAANLVLFCPAAYAASAWALPFGGGFSEAIRRRDSYLDTDAAAICADYPGNVLYVIGDRDEVIPGPVDRLYSTSFRQARRFQKLLLADCPHPIHRYAPGKPALVAQIREALARFVAGSRLAPPPGQGTIDTARDPMS